MSTPPPETPEQWAIIELMGHIIHGFTAGKSTQINPGLKGNQTSLALT